MATDSVAVAEQIEVLPQRLLGQTGEQVPVLGLGTAPGGMGLDDADAVNLIHRSLDLGVTYLDTAPAYERAQKQVGQVMVERREEAFLVTKTHAAEAEKTLEILEQSLEDLQTEQVDLVFVHSLGSLDVEQVLAPDGALAGLREAQRRGWTRYIGFTAHNAPWKAAKVLAEAQVDAVMLAMNLADRYTYGFEEDALRLAQERGVGVAAMKVFGGAPGMKYDKPTHSALAEHGHQDLRAAFRYALGLEGVAIAVVGMYSEAELVQNIEWARNYEPLDGKQAEILAGQGRTIAADWGEHFGAVK
ncbi:MAG: aldo/keto reductase [bacterium]|nr:aldo/keto reductase [bacterium]